MMKLAGQSSGIASCTVTVSCKLLLLLYVAEGLDVWTKKPTTGHWPTAKVKVRTKNPPGEGTGVSDQY